MMKPKKGCKRGIPTVLQPALGVRSAECEELVGNDPVEISVLHALQNQTEHTGISTPTSQWWALFKCLLHIINSHPLQNQTEHTDISTPTSQWWALCVYYTLLFLETTILLITVYIQ